MGNNLKPDQPESPNKEDPIVLLATKINLVNVKNYNQFINTMHFDTEESGIYTQAMQEPNII